MATKPSLALIPSGYKANKLYSVLPSNGDGDFNFSRGSTATRINKDGLIENVDANVPRLNYSLIDGVVSGCPSLLLEPQTTNIGKYSEQISSWFKGRATVSDNQGISPDGTQNASKLTVTNEANTHVVYFNNTNVITAGLNYVMSIFVKKSTTNYIRFSEGFSNSNLVFNFDTEELTASGNSTINDLSFEKYPNNWYRLSMKFIGDTSLDVQSAIFIRDNNNNESYTGSNEAVFIWGLQIEQSTFTTSYIKNPSTGSTTRSAETCNNAGDVNTFNDSEGVLFGEISALSLSDTSVRRIGITKDGTYEGLRIQLGNNDISATVYDGTSNQYSRVISYNNEIPNKIALKYKENDFALWINGIEYLPQSSGSTFADGTLNDLSFDYVGGAKFYGNTKQLQYFDTALTDTDLEELTSWTSFNEMANAQQ